MAQKGFKAKKAPTKKEVQSENNQLSAALEQMQQNMQFLGQQVFNTARQAELINKDLGAMTSLLRRSEVDDVVKESDAVLIAFSGILKETGETFEGGFSMETIVNVGSGTFLPGFEEALKGMKVGETKVIDVDFPETYPDNLKNKKGEFTVKLIKIYRLREDDAEIALLHADRLKAEKAKKEKEQAAEDKANEKAEKQGSNS